MSEHTSTVEVTVNGEKFNSVVEDRKLLIHYLRDDLGFTGVHQGCVVGKCGACTVLQNGVPKKSCMLYAVQLDGEEVTTVEGLASKARAEGTAIKGDDDRFLHPLQVGFKKHHGLQCGYCTPGLLLTASALLDGESDLNREEIRSAITGNICRCTGYSSIVDSISWASETLSALRDDGETQSVENGTEDGNPTNEGGSV